MPLEIQDLPLIVILAVSFAIALVITAIVITAIGRALKNQPEESEEQKPEMKQGITRTSGEHLNKLYQYSVYVLVFEILVILLVFSFYGITDTMEVSDAWPFILVVVVIVFTSLAIIDWSKLRTKRTVQKDMRRY